MPETPTPAASFARPRYVKVAVNSGRPTRLTFSYSIPPGRTVACGEVVHVPWGVRTLQGVVVEGPLDTPGFDPAEVRPLEGAIDAPPRIPVDRMALAAWLQHYYLAPPWEAHALFLPPGAGERPRTAVARGAGAPSALSERQQAIYDALTETPVDTEELRDAMAPALTARGFDAALGVLIRRRLVERHYTLAPARARPRVVEVVRLAVAPAQARAFADAIEGRRSSRRARAIRTLAAAGRTAPFADVAREARGAPAVETLIAEGVLAREGEHGDLVRLLLPEVEVTRLLRVLSRGRTEQAAVAILERLAAAGDRGEEPVLPVRGLPAEVGGDARAAVEGLVAARMVTVQGVLDRRDPLRHLVDLVLRPPVELIAEQRKAAVRIRAAIDREDGSGILLHGVTGSGKTEVYLGALRHAVERGRRGIVLVPEIALTPQTVRRFAERFPGRVGVLHSGLSLGEAYDEWHRIARGEYDVVIGSRSAIFAPQPDLGLIVIDEAHEWTYKQHDPAPRYDARTVAAELARHSGAALVYGTATPDAERWLAAAGNGALERVDLPRRIRVAIEPAPHLAPSSEMPEVRIVDMRGSHELFSPRLIEALGETLDRDEQAILFLNRRGRAGYLLCPRGHSPTCPSCDVSMSTHDIKESDGTVRKGARLVCHQCGRSRSAPSRCIEGACGQPLRPVRAGTQQVESEVRRHYPTARVVRWDRDTARTAEQHGAILRQFVRHEADVLVGTQMVAKGLDLPLVTLVGVVLADYTLREGDFRARERTFQLLVQVAGRAGRAERPGRVIIQTLQPEEPAILAAAANDIDRFYADELARRAELGYPPFRRLVRLLFSHESRQYAGDEAQRLATELRTIAAGRPGVDILGPTPPQVARLRGRHRWAILVRGDDPAALVRDVDLPPGWAIDVDPLVVS
ncbi:MAG: primosomal protein N' [Dehalococcoidia bacterium]